jgi:hypothetical protein
LSAIDKAPVRVPICVGLKVTLTVQLAPVARLEVHVWFWLKSPLVVMLVMLSEVTAVFVTVTVLAALIVFNN